MTTPQTTIMLVEDSENIRHSMTTVLRMKGYRVVEAADGLQAVERAPREKPDLILMDLNMPVLDGWEATRRLRRLDETRDTPIIGLSADCEEGWREEAIDAGCDDCLPKPVDARTLNKTLTQFLRRKVAPTT